MGAILRPRRGTKAVADSKNFVLAKGEIFFEVPSGGVGKGLGRIKMGDGSTAYKNLPYFQELDLIAATGLDNTSKSIIRTNIGAGTSNLALGTSSSTAYRGDYGNTAYNHSQSTHARTDATKVEASSTNGKIKINGTETTVYTHPGSGTNPHGTTKKDVGLENVGNFLAVSTASQSLTDAQKTQARTNIAAASAADVTQLNNDLSSLSEIVTDRYNASLHINRNYINDGIINALYNSSDRQWWLDLTQRSDTPEQYELVVNTDGIEHRYSPYNQAQQTLWKIPGTIGNDWNTMIGGNAYGHPNLYNGPTVSGSRNDYLLIGSSFVTDNISPNQFYRSELLVTTDEFTYNYYDNSEQATISRMLPWTRGRINTKLVFNRTGISLNFQGTTLAFILIGFCQNIGSVFIAVSISNGSIVSKKDLLTGTDWDHSALTISFSGTTLTFSSNSDGFNYVSIFGDGISNALL